MRSLPVWLFQNRRDVKPLLKDQRNYSEQAEYHTGDAIGIAECHIYLAQVVRLYQQVLVGKHGYIECGPYPEYPIKMPNYACADDKDT